MKSRGLPSSGNKNELINRLEKALADTDPGEFNVNAIELQAGYYDDDSTPQEDMGLIMRRKMDNIKPEVEARRKKIGGSQF